MRAARSPQSVGTGWNDGPPGFSFGTPESIGNDSSNVGPGSGTKDSLGPSRPGGRPAAAAGPPRPPAETVSARIAVRLATRTDDAARFAAQNVRIEPRDVVEIDRRPVGSTGHPVLAGAFRSEEPDGQQAPVVGERRERAEEDEDLERAAECQVDE